MVLNKIGSDQSNSRSSWGNRGGYSGANNNGGRCCFFLSSTFLLIGNFSWNFLLQFIKILAHHIGEATMVVKSIAEQEEVRTIQTDIIHSYIQQWFRILLFRKVTMPRRLGTLCWIWLTPNVTFTLGFHTTFTTATSLSLASQASFQSPPQGMPVYPFYCKNIIAWKLNRNNV